MNNNKIIIGLTSPKRHGKDTFAQLLTAYIPDLKSWAFADQLKDDLDPVSLKMFNKRAKDLDGEEKEIFRDIMIGYGCGWRKIDIDHWVKVIDKAIDDSNDKYHCIKDMRFPSEVNFFKQKYGVNFELVEINREGGPEPTDEEKRNIPLLQSLIDYRIKWPTISPEKKLDVLHYYVQDFYSHLFYKDLT